MHNPTSPDTSTENIECQECGCHISQEVFDKHIQCFDKMKYKCPIVFDRYFPLKKHVVKSSVHFQGRKIHKQATYVWGQTYNRVATAQGKQGI